MKTIILVQSLSEFTAEIAAPGPVRLALTESAGAARLDLQALTPAGLVWLSDRYSRHCPPEIHAQLPAARELVARWLAGRGYEVRPGRWATPADYRPQPGTFGCFAWHQVGKRWILGP